MTVDVETILCNTQSQLKELGEAIENLVATYPDVFDAVGIREKLDDFRQSHREAVDRLKTPNFSIAQTARPFPDFYSTVTDLAKLRG